MELLEYLQNYFYTKEELLGLTQITETELRRHQQDARMPKASYTVDLDLTCNSIFGTYSDSPNIEYYAKGYTSWIGYLKTSSPDSKSPFHYFYDRYRKQLSEYITEGFLPEKFQTDAGGLDEDTLEYHIQSEWKHFLEGTYGLCTKSGLPEDIADKEFAIAMIDEITQDQTKTTLTTEERDHLRRFVRILDQASALFAPHERAQSSRKRCIDDVILKYQLDI